MSDDGTVELSKEQVDSLLEGFFKAVSRNVF